jgi:hypothetical protein
VNNPPPPDGSWMLVNNAAAGTRHHNLEPEERSRTLRETHWFQERIEGIDVGLFVAREDRARWSE